LKKLPKKPFPLPDTAPHLVQYLAKKSSKGKRGKKNFLGGSPPIWMKKLQVNINTIIDKHYETLKT